MTHTKRIQLSPANLDPVLHCPRCFRYRTHWRRIESGMEIYRCMVCGNIQRYTINRQYAESEA
jgi:RNase P subunit RPR2